MIDPNVCCLDEDEFEEKIRLSRDAKLRIMSKPKDTGDSVKDPIAEADSKGKSDYLEADEMFMRSTRMDVKTIFYLEDRMKSCYRLRHDSESFGPLLNCFKDTTLREPVECECDIRNYLREITKEKHTFSEELSKTPKKKEASGKGKDDKTKGKGKDGKAKSGAK